MGHVLFLLIFDTWWYLKNKAIAQAPLFIPPKRGEEDKRHIAVPAISN
jgi:hypothetical protein